MKQTTRQILRKAALETLEERRLCSTVTFIDGVLTLRGDSDRSSNFIVDFSSDGSGINAYVTGSPSQTLTAEELKKILIVGGERADRVYINPKITAAAEITGGEGNDTIHSGGGHDIIDAGAGNDQVYGRAGDDNISGGDGVDLLNGGDGNDNIQGGTGRNFINGGSGNDTLVGGEDNDLIAGEGGHDSVIGNGGTDIIRGGIGNDTLQAGGGSENTLMGDSGNDMLVAATASDKMLGGAGFNTLVMDPTTGQVVTPPTMPTPDPVVDTPSTPTAPTTPTTPTTPTAPPPVATPTTPTTPTIPTSPATPTTPTSPTDVAAPTAVINTLEDSVMAGMAFHVHGLDSVLKSGTEIDAKYEWNFGDDGSKYNTLVGFNAAHVYDTAGTYTITLKVTNKDGKSAITTLTVNIAADTRRVIYVDPAGNDAATGLSPDDAVRTVARANQLIDNNTKIVFKRGGTYDITTKTGGFHITKANVVIGAYGSGNAPVIRRSGTVDGGTLITFANEAKDFMVQDLTFTSTITSDTSQTNRPIVMSARGTNISIRNCTVHNVGYMVTTIGSPKGTLVQDNNSPDITGLSGYMVWMESSDIVVLGNKAANSTREHILRSSSNTATRILVAHNDLTNVDRTDVDGGDQAKTTINVRAGSFVYVTQNKLSEGVVGFGPTLAMTEDQVASSIVVDSNHIHSTMLQVATGTYNFVARNNLLDATGGEQIQLKPTDYRMTYRTSSNWTIANNTGVNTTSTGKFIKVYSSGAVGTISVLNNLFIAPNLTNGAAMDVHGNMSMFKDISHNVWPATGTGARNIVNDIVYTQTQWEDTSEVENDVYLHIGAADGYTVTLPTFSAGLLAA